MKKRSLREKVVQWFVSVDPLNNQMPWASPFEYAASNPVRLNDPSGMAPNDPGGGEGMILGDDGSYYPSGEKNTVEIIDNAPDPTGISAWFNQQLENYADYFKKGNESNGLPLDNSMITEQKVSEPEGIEVIYEIIHSLKAAAIPDKSILLSWKGIDSFSDAFLYPSDKDLIQVDIEVNQGNVSEAFDEIALYATIFELGAGSLKSSGSKAPRNSPKSKSSSSVKNNAAVESGLSPSKPAVQPVISAPKTTPGQIAESGFGTSTTTVGRWMSSEEAALMQNGSPAAVGAGGKTSVTVGGPNIWNSAKPGSVYIEFQVPTNSLVSGGGEGIYSILGPNASKSQMFQLKKIGGQVSPPVQNISRILKVK